MGVQEVHKRLQLCQGCVCPRVCHRWGTLLIPKSRQLILVDVQQCILQQYYICPAQWKRLFSNFIHNSFFWSIICFKTKLGWKSQTCHKVHRVGKFHLGNIFPRNDAIISEWNSSSFSLSVRLSGVLYWELPFVGAPPAVCDDASRTIWPIC